MKKILFVVTMILTFTISFNLFASDTNYYVLYGFKIGQEIKFVEQELGKPDKIFPFEDGWKAYAYRRKGYNVIFETDNTRPDLIISIQIEGEKNPIHMGFNGIDLSFDAKEAIKKLGTPTERKQSVDSVIKKSIPNTFINFYGKNFSFEEKDNKITSIKVIFNEQIDIKNTQPDFDFFLNSVKSKNYYQIASFISSDFSYKEKKIIQGSIIEQITGKSELNNLLYGKDGIASLTSKDIADVNLRLIGGLSGFVYKFNGKPIAELFFVRSFEGWVLFEAY